MTPNKISQVAQHLIDELETKGIEPVRFDPGRFLSEATNKKMLEHALYLLHNVVGFVDDDRIGKANRHLASAQTILSFARFGKVEDFMRLNKP